MQTSIVKAGTLLLALGYSLSCPMRAHACEQRQPSVGGGTVFPEPLEWAGPTFGPLKLNLSDNKPCEVDLVIKDKARIALSLVSIDDSDTQKWTLEIHYGNAWGPLISKAELELSVRGQEYTFPAGRYALLLTTSQTYKETAKKTATHILSVASYLRVSRPIITYGVPQSLYLEKYGGYADSLLTVGARSTFWIELSLPSGWNTDDVNRMRVTAILGDDKRIDPIYASSDGLSVRYFFLLDAGDYKIEVQRRANQWPTPALDPRLTKELRLQLLNFNPDPIPAQFRAFSDWLKSNSLGEIEFLFDYRPGLERYEVPAEVAQEFQKDFEAVSNEATSVFSEKDGKLIVQHDEGRKPKRMLILRTSADRERISAIEEAFYEATGSSFWDHVLRKAASIEGVPTRTIVAHLPVYCAPSVIYEREPGQADRHGGECLMGSAKQTVILPSNTSSQPGRDPIPRKVSLQDSAQLFLKTFLPGDAQFEFIDRSDTSVEIMVRNIRGQVIPMGRMWEKIDISLILSKVQSQQFELLVFVDGLTATGLGRYPPDSQFTTGLEPEHAGELSTFARKVALSYRNFLEGAR
jgi:hypothetical protein